MYVMILIFSMSGTPTIETQIVGEYKNKVECIEAGLDSELSPKLREDRQINITFLCVRKN